jgi:hypothetical protein
MDHDLSVLVHAEALTADEATELWAKMASVWGDVSVASGPRDSESLRAHGVRPELTAAGDRAATALSGSPPFDPEAWLVHISGASDFSGVWRCSREVLRVR